MANKKPKPDAKGSKPGEKQTTAPKGSGAAKDAGRVDPMAKPLWGSNRPIGDVIKNLPPSFAEGVKNKLYTSDANGLAAFFIKGGVNPNDLVTLSQTPEGVSKLISFASSPEFKIPGGSGVESNVAGASTATDLADKEPRKPFKPITGRAVKKLVGGVAEGASGAGDLKRVNLKQTGNSVEVTARYRRKGPGEGGEAAAAAAQGTNAADAVQGQQSQQQSPPAKKTLPSFSEAVEAAKQKYIDDGVAPPFYVPAKVAIQRNYPTMIGAGAGILGLGSLGYGITSALSSGSSGEQKQAQPQMSPEQKEALRRERQQILYGMPPDAPQQPAPQQNPAGTPPANNSTLLMRLQQSRMV